MFTDTCDKVQKIKLPCQGNNLNSNDVMRSLGWGTGQADSTRNRDGPPWMLGPLYASVFALAHSKPGRP